MAESSNAAAHRKIELQAPEDFSYLINNVRRAAAESIAAAFPAVEGAEDEDDLRVRVEQLVNEYITRTFSLAAPSLTINGLAADPAAFLSSSTPSPAEEEEDAFEPFDARKRQRVEDLAREEEDLLAELAALKRTVPAAVAARYADAARVAAAADEAALTARVDAAREAARAGGTTLDVRPLERQADVEAAFRRAVTALDRCKRDMPAAVARMERARVAGEYVLTGR